jgi:hypothetical protein
MLIRPALARSGEFFEASSSTSNQSLGRKAARGIDLYLMGESKLL